jgi:hypothetical protein
VISQNTALQINYSDVIYHHIKQKEKQMAIITIRNCIVCDTEMKCTRASKRICSNVCHTRLHRMREKLGLSKEEMTAKLIKDQQEKV